VAEVTGEAAFTSRERRELFLNMAASESGVTVAEVHEAARTRGDGATVEAYHNIARRLAHRALLVPIPQGGSASTRYRLGATGGEVWLQEEELAEVVDPDYPLLALPVLRESVQQINRLDESVWRELRDRLAQENAQDLFARAITSYFGDFVAQVAELAEHADPQGHEYARLKKRADNSRLLLLRMTKYGLGLSNEAITVPMSMEIALREHGQGVVMEVNEPLLREEINRRIEPTTFLVPVSAPAPTTDPEPIVGAVDGSTRGGLLGLAAEDGDFNLAHAPLVSINTAVGQVNRSLDVKGRLTSLFIRLPERPEDMQRQDNRHTVMAKLLHPDLSDSQYMHAVWNAMDLVEIRTTHRLLRRWYAPGGKVEIPPADVVLRDGTVTPQDRDFTHYKEQDSYGLIVRDMIDLSWEVAIRCREENRTVCGVVKATQLWFYGPILNWFAGQLAAQRSQIKSWPMESMNYTPDQLLITRLLTAGRSKGDGWMRTCVVLRPFHSITNFAQRYSREQHPADRVLEDHAARLNAPERDDHLFWTNFQGAADPFVKMLREVQYGSFFLAAVPRLDNDNMLPRFELLVPARTEEGAPQPWSLVAGHLSKVLRVVRAMGFDVSAEHGMFLSEPKLDVLPRLLIKAHDTVKVWASELLTRVQEYVGYHLARHTRDKRVRGVQVRPFTRPELLAFYEELKRERDRQAGASPRLDSNG
jgi:hypothetical protein